MQGDLKSNDHDIVALAIVSGAEILCTNDIKLIEDYKRHTSGKIYPLDQKISKKHRELLNKHGVCPRLRKK